MNKKISINDMMLAFLPEFPKPDWLQSLSSGSNQPSTSLGVSSVGPAMKEDGDRFLPHKTSSKIKSEKYTIEAIKPVKRDVKKDVKKVNKVKFVPPKSRTKPSRDKASVKRNDADAILKDLNLFKQKHKQSKPKEVAKALFDQIELNPTPINPVQIPEVTDDTHEAEFGPVETISNTSVDKTDDESVPQNQKSELEKERYVCGKCQKVFSYMKRFNDHEFKANCNLDVYQCAKCNIKLKDARGLKRHLRTFHEKTRFQCGICWKIFPSQESVDKHTQSRHDPVECKLCRKIFKNKNTQRVHNQKCSKKKNAIDNVSDQAGGEIKVRAVIEEAGGSKKKLKNAASHAPNNYLRACDRCKKTYNSRGGFSRHMKSHRQADNNSELKKMVTAGMLKESDIEKFRLKDSIEIVFVEAGTDEGTDVEGIQAANV